MMLQRARVHCGCSWGDRKPDVKKNEESCGFDNKTYSDVIEKNVVDLMPTNKGFICFSSHLCSYARF